MIKKYDYYSELFMLFFYYNINIFQSNNNIIIIIKNLIKIIKYNIKTKIK